MTSSFTISESATFTVTHARQLASKVATDLKRVQRFYGEPSDLRIAAYEAELVLLIKHGYLAAVTYGFKRNDAWIQPTIRYTARDLFGLACEDDDPGRIRPGAVTSDASFCSFLEKSTAWSDLSDQERCAFGKHLPLQRTYGSEPTVAGYLQVDRTYSAGGRALQRETVRSW